MNRDINCSWVVHYYKLHVIYLYKMFEIWSNIYFFFAQDELSIHVEGTIEGKPEEGKRKETRAGGTPSGVFRTTTAALVPTRMSNTGRAGAMKKGHAMISFTISLCNNCFEDKKYKAKYDYLMQLFKQSSQKNIQNIQIFTSWWMSSFAMRWDAAQKKRTDRGGRRRRRDLRRGPRRGGPPGADLRALRGPGGISGGGEGFRRTRNISRTQDLYNKGCCPTNGA